MLTSTSRTSLFRRFYPHLFSAFGVMLAFGALSTAEAQDRLPKMPGYQRYTEMRPKYQEAQQSLFTSFVSGSWSVDGKAYEFTQNGKTLRYDFATGTTTPVTAPTTAPATRRGGRRMGGVERGRQFTSADSPDGKMRAVYKDHNVWLGDAEGKNLVPVTRDGDGAKRIKYGTGSWVYGEELAQTTAMWWSPDGKKLAFYRFDESQVKDYHLALEQLNVQTRLDSEPYPKAGAPNPIVDLMVYDVETKKTTRIDVRDGKPFNNDVVGYYVYEVRWSQDGKTLLCNRANRRQNTIAFTACNPDTGVCRTIVEEVNPNGWVSEHPPITFLADGKRFLLISERTGFYNIYLYDLSGTLLSTLTQHNVEVERVVKVDEKAGVVFYTARTGDNPHKLQLHKVGLDGKGDKRITDPALNHQVDIAPDGKHFLDTAQAHDVLPSTRLLDENGKVLTTLSRVDPAKFSALGAPPAEVFSFKTADGKTDLYGILFRPTNFDPNKKYPLIVQVYGGPETTGVSETYQMAPRLTELGFLVAKFDSRGGGDRGRAFKDAMYMKMGTVEIDDQAEGVKFLRQRPYVDGGRVGIEGTSYGGYASAMALLRHPDVFQAACASSSVTDWRNYDTIYTERYMWLPQENTAGYEAGSAMTYAPNLKGRLMLYFGTADNNVHPANTFQLIGALQRAGKSYELQAGPDQEHTMVNYDRMLEFFIESLVLPSPLTLQASAK